MAGVVLKNICKIYPSRDKKHIDGVMAVKNFNMEIEDNEFIVFVGPSGCGKSTTLRMIAGLEEISSGELYIDGQYMNDTEPKNRDISMVFQNYALYPHMTAYKNIAFGLTLRKTAVPDYEDNETVNAKLIEIASLTAEIKAAYGRVVNNEKKLGPLQKKLSQHNTYLEHIDSELSALKEKKIKSEAMQNKIVKLTGIHEQLVTDITSLENEISETKKAISADKTRMIDGDAKIKAIRSEIVKFQKYDIDLKTVAKYEKNVEFYKRLAQKDEKYKEKLKLKLADKEKQLAELGNEPEDIKSQLKKESLEEEIKFIREELEILITRSATIEKCIADNTEKAEYYRKTKQPGFIYRHYTKEEIDRKVRAASDILDIGGLLNRKPREMSGGQRQRIALGRAIVREPKVFLLDEPLSNLDAKLRATMRGEISKLHEQLKTTFIYVTHDQIEAMTMGTRIVVMKDGIIQQIDTPTNLFDYPENTFVAGFIGTPQMNMFNVKLSATEKEIKTVFSDETVMKFNKTDIRRLVPEFDDGNEHDGVIGCRGENIALASNGLKATVGLVEILGDETHLHLTADCVEEGKEIIVKLGTRGEYKQGDQVFITFTPSKIQLFDRETQKTILERN